MSYSQLFIEGAKVALLWCLTWEKLPRFHSFEGIVISRSLPLTRYVGAFLQRHLDIALSQGLPIHFTKRFLFLYTTSNCRNIVWLTYHVVQTPEIPFPNLALIEIVFSSQQWMNHFPSYGSKTFFLNP